MIDLHLHTTASDGLLSPDALVERLAETGIHTFSVTDYDTVAGLARAEAAAARHGLRFVPGIEITAVEDGLVAIEVWHSDHDDETTMRYLAQAEALGLLTTGGSDYHGDLPDRNARLGGVGVPEAAFDRFFGVLRDARARVFPNDGDGNGAGAGGNGDRP